MNVLIIEDNENNLYLQTLLLKARGHDVTGAMDGKSGIDIAANNPFDMILVDIQLPDMDGYDVTRRLVKLSTQKNALIVAVTSYAMSGDREKAFSAGFHHYVEKPIEPDTFVVALEQLLEREHS